MTPPAHKTAKIIATHVAFWTALCITGALGSYVDRIGFGRPEPYARILLDW